MDLANLTRHLDELLQVRGLPDYPPAVNGLQLQNRSGGVTKVAAAVDAHLPVVKEAIARGCDLLVVHHGLFWSGVQPITGAAFEKLRLAMENNLAIYSAHLPLDGHLELGNAILLARAIEPDAAWQPFFPFKDFHTGMRATVELPRDEVLRRFEEALGSKVHLCAGGPETVRQIGVLTGGAGDAVAQMKAEGIDTFLTGEGPHWSYTLAEELGINVLYGGHYATETFGVIALALHLEQEFGLPWDFVDHPTGL